MEECKHCGAPISKTNHGDYCEYCGSSLISLEESRRKEQELLNLQRDLDMNVASLKQFEYQNFVINQILSLDNTDAIRTMRNFHELQNYYCSINRGLY